MNQPVFPICICGHDASFHFCRICIHVEGCRCRRFMEYTPAMHRVNAAKTVVAILFGAFGLLFLVWLLVNA